MAGAGAGRDRHDARLFCRVGAAPHPAGPGRPRGDPCAGPFGKGRGLYGRRLCPHQTAPRGVHGAVGRCGQPRLGSAGRLSRAQPGHRADRAQGAVLPAPQRLSGDPARAALCRGDQVLDPGRRDRRAAAPVAPRLARGAGRDPAPDPSRFLRAAGRRDRARPDRGAAGDRSRGAADPGAPAGRRLPPTSSVPRRR